VTWNTREKGLIFLEYDDPDLGDDQWIRAQVTVPKNDNTGSIVVLRPEGVLPNNATIRVIVEEGLQDLAGQNNRSTIGYTRIVATFETEEAFASRFDAVSVDFASTDLLDPEAALRDPFATVQNGLLTASFEFEGSDTPFDYRPTAVSTVLSTVRQQVAPVQGSPSRSSAASSSSATSPSRRASRCRASAPTRWSSWRRARCRSTVTSPSMAAMATRSIRSTAPTSQPQAVRASAAAAAAARAARTPAEPRRWARPASAPTSVVTRVASAAKSAARTRPAVAAAVARIASRVTTTSMASRMPRSAARGGGNNGGAAGPAIVSNTNPDDDFFGSLVNGNGELVVGEFVTPLGGAGGGGGGDRTTASFSQTNGGCFATGTAWLNDEKGRRRWRRRRCAGHQGARPDHRQQQRPRLRRWRQGRRW
jgi:hypothetical protein